MQEAGLINLPVQPMLGNDQIQVLRSPGFSNEQSFVPHRHNFYMLYWANDGVGQHRIDFIDRKIIKGRMFFLHQNQVHQMVDYPQDGWMILFNQVLFQGFVRQNPTQEQNGLFDYFNRLPYVDMGEELAETINCIVELLQKELFNAHNLPLIQHYLSLLLLHAGIAYLKNNQFKQNSFEAEIMRKLKIRIGKHFKHHRDTLFYSEILGLPSRKLNEISVKTMGRLVFELVSDRLLCEAEALLGATAKSIKEISYELGFVDQAHFAFFFKKANGQTPRDFRKQFI